MILTDTQEAIRRSVRAYAQERILPRSREFETSQCFPFDLFEELADLGLLGMTVPEELGGAGADYVAYVAALIEIAAADGALSTILSIQNSLIVPALVKDGTPDQRVRFLQDLIAGRALGAFALTEADAGSDPSAMRTRAVKVAGGYCISGTKQFITAGSSAGFAIVYAVTDPVAEKRGITAFLVPTDRAGYSVDKSEDKLGQRASDTCALRFDDMFVEDNLRLGAEGAGYRMALSNLELGRIGIAAQCIGMAQAAMEIAIGYAKDRQTFGKPIIEHQAVGFRLADMAARLEASRQLLLHAALMKDSGQPCLQQASMAKLVASETAEAVVSNALQTLGGYGYLEDYRVAKIYRDVRVCQIYEGTSDIQRMLIARSL